MAQKLKGDSQVSNYLAEFLGTFLIVTTVAGSGFMMSDLGILPGVDLAIIAASVGLVLFVVISFLSLSAERISTRLSPSRWESGSKFLPASVLSTSLCSFSARSPGQWLRT